jgi:hypothetical protein
MLLIFLYPPPPPALGTHNVLSSGVGNNNNCLYATILRSVISLMKMMMRKNILSQRWRIKIKNVRKLWPATMQARYFMQPWQNQICRWIWLPQSLKTTKRVRLQHRVKVEEHRLKEQVAAEEHRFKAKEPTQHMKLLDMLHEGKISRDM